MAAGESSPEVFPRPLLGRASVTIAKSMNRGTLYSVCVLVLFLWNCPTRQTANRIVYVPAPPPAAGSTASQDTDSLVIEEPQPPEPEETPPAEQPSVSTPPVKRRPRPATRTETSAPPESPPEIEPPPVEVPALEPRENPGRQAAQRQQITSLQDQVRNRIGRLEKTNLSGEDRHTLEDARTFLGNSERALAGSDFERALNLVRKASMLIAVLEQQ